jgi:HK97 family phage major capsid protein
MRNGIILRKIGGRFDACWRGSGLPCNNVASRGGLGSSLLGLVGAFALMLFLPILVLGLVAIGLRHVSDHLVTASSIVSPLGIAGLAIGHTVDVEKTIKDLNQAFVTFKDSNDERLKEIEKKGTASADVVQNVEKANNAITKMETDLRAALATIKEIETKQARFAEAGSPEAKAREVKNAVQFFSMASGRVVENVTTEQVEQYQNYKKALNTYFRRGPQAIEDSSIRNALSTGAAPSGGFWLTPDTSGRVVELVFQTSPIRQLAAVQTIGTDTLEGFNDLDEASSGWVGEQDPRNETLTPDAMGKYQITMQEQYANPKITQKMLDDSFFDVEGWLARKVANKMARTENAAYVNGNGILKPKGFLNYALAGKPSKANWKQIEQLGTGLAGAYPVASPADKIIDLIALLKVEYRQGAAFGMNTTSVAATRKLKDGQGNYLFFPSFVNGVATPPAASSLGGGDTREGAGLAQSGTLFGFPVYELQDMPDMAANSLSVILAKWEEFYQIIDHTVGIRVLRDPYTGKPYVSYYTTKRTGGDVINFEAAKILKFG